MKGCEYIGTVSFLLVVLLSASFTESAQLSFLNPNLKQSKASIYHRNRCQSIENLYLPFSTLRIFQKSRTREINHIPVLLGKDDKSLEVIENIDESEKEEEEEVKEFFFSKEEITLASEIVQKEQTERGPASAISNIKIDDLSEKNKLPLPKALHYLLPSDFPTLSKARKVIRNGGILLKKHSNENEEEIVARCDTCISHDDKIILLPQSMHKKKGKKKIGNRNEKPIPVIFEDDYIAVINKPRGLAVHGKGEYSLLHKLPFLLQPTRVPEDESLSRPIHVHRLDAPTGGLLLIAKTKSALKILTNAFSSREIDKEYIAVVVGSLNSNSSQHDNKKPSTVLLNTYLSRLEEDEKGKDGKSLNQTEKKEFEAEDSESTIDESLINPVIESSILGKERIKALSADPDFRIIDTPIGGRTSLSLFKTLSITKSYEYGELSTIALKLITGRQHQLRRHLSSLNHPILGDVRYGDGKNQITTRGLFLFSKTLTFHHPVTAELLHFSLEEPEIFGNQRNMERKKYENASTEDKILSN